MRHVLLLSLLFVADFLGAQGFSYPIPPDSIRDRQGRVTFMIEHFWNKETIRDTNLFQSPKLLMDYLYLLQQTDEEEATQHTKTFIDIASGKLTFANILFWLDNILYDSSSQLYDESLYTKLLNAVMVSNVDSVMKMLPAQRLEMMHKNQIGNKATNFTFVDKSEAENELYQIEAPLLLLIFNNPDCSLCNKSEELIENDMQLQALVTNGQLTILAITPNAEYDEWIEHTYPSNWIVGFDKDKNIYNKRLYDIQRLPCMYLLDEDKQVLLKEADYNRICQYLYNHVPTKKYP